MADRDNPPSLDDISERLREARGSSGDGVENGAHGASGSAKASGLGIGMRISIELVTTVAVGAGLGYAIDSWLGTMPIFLIVFILMGGAAGVMNAYRVVKGLDDSVGLGGAVARKERAEGNNDRG